MEPFSPALTITLGATILTVIAIAFGGTFMLRVVTGKQGANDLQKTFFRAGHAHAGVIVTLGLVIALVTHVADVSSRWSSLSAGSVLSAAIFIPTGFFLSVIGHEPQRPNRLAKLIWVGAATLAVGLGVAGVTTIAAGVDRL
jgi:hypothetical protein